MACDWKGKPYRRAGLTIFSSKLYYQEIKPPTHTHTHTYIHTLLSSLPWTAYTLYCSDEAICCRECRPLDRRPCHRHGVSWGEVGGARRQAGNRKEKDFFFLFPLTVSLSVSLPFAIVAAWETGRWAPVILGRLGIPFVASLLPTSSGCIAR